MVFIADKHIVWGKAYVDGQLRNPPHRSLARAIIDSNRPRKGSCSELSVAGARSVGEQSACFARKRVQIKCLFAEPLFLRDTRARIVDEESSLFPELYFLEARAVLAKSIFFCG